MRPSISLAAVIIVLLSQTAMGTIINVPGDYASIQTAIGFSSNGDTVLVVNGTYTENIDFLGKAILLTSENGPEYTTIKILTSGSPVVTFANGEGSGSILSGFTVEGDSSYWGIHVNGTSPFIYNNIIIKHEVGVRIDGGSPLIRKNEITLCSHSTIAPRNGGAIRMVQGTNAIIDSNEIHDNYSDVAGGIYLNQCSNITVERNLIYSNSSVYIGGLEITNCSDIEAYNNTFVDNTSLGPQFILGSINVSISNNVTVINNISAFNNEYGICNYQDNTNLVTAYNDVYSNSPAGYYNWSPGTGSISADPLFIDPANDNYDLGGGSPCINAGDPSRPFDPDGTISDMGALYYPSGPLTYGSLAGAVTDTFGSPIQNVHVVEPYYGHEAWTDISGDYFIDSLITWTGYDIQFSHPDFVDTTVYDVEITEDNTTILDVAMSPVPRPGAITGTVTDEFMAPIESVYVVISDSGWDTYTDVNGEFIFDDLYPDEYDLIFSHSDYVPQYYYDVVVLSNETTVLNAVLYEYGSVAGTVSDTAGSPVENVIVTDNVTGNKDTTLADGEYSLNLLPAGPHNITFSHYLYGNVTFRDVIVSSGQITYLDVILYEPAACEYAVGDANFSGSFNILDPLYSVYYFNGMVSPAYSCECTQGNVWYVESDVNGSCSHNGLDITYMFSYLRHYWSELTPCPDCPPADWPSSGSNYEQIIADIDFDYDSPLINLKDYNKFKSDDILLTDEGVELWFGNVDESPIDILPGDSVEIDVYIQTAADAFVSCFNLPLGSDDDYISGFLSESLGRTYNMPVWDIAEFVPADSSPPNPAGWSSQSLLASIESGGPMTGDWLHFESPTLIGTFVLQTVNDPSFANQTVQCIGPGISSRSGAAVFGDTTATIEHEVTQHFSPIHFLDPSVYVGDLMGTVTNNAQDPIEGATVTVEGAGLSDISEAAGDYMIENITRGTYNVGFSHPLYCDTILSGVSIVYNEITTADIVMTGTGFIGGTVTDVGLIPIESTVVNVIGTNIIDTTDTSGEYLLEYICPGPQSVSFNKSGYNGHVADNIIVIEGNTTSYDAILWPEPSDDIVVWYGSPDGSPILATIGERLNIDVYLQTKEDIHIGFIHVALGLEDQYFDSLLSEDEGQVYDVLTQWGGPILLPPFGSPPNPAGWSCESMVGWRDTGGETNPSLNCPALTRIITFVVHVPDDTSLIGNQVPCLGPGISYHATVFEDTLDNEIGNFVEHFSSVVFTGPGATGTISGTVTDPVQFPIENVFVTVQGTGVSDTTENSGEYLCEDIPPGTYDVSFYHPDYIPSTVNDLGVYPYQTTVVDVTLYEFSGGCVYIVGDVNSSGAFNGLDVTFGVNFFKGGAEPLYSCECTPGNIWYVAGDVNNSCNYNGLDITYGVAYFKGGPDPMP
ncbi:MAG: carboxypeptidase regulatory-like domain-containing protein, partial [Candidatus Zixiibacteriota bacterium]